MRITASVTGILLIAAVAVAQDGSIAAAVAVPQDGSVAVAPVAVVLDDAAIAEQVVALRKHVAVTTVSEKVAQNKKTLAKTQVVKIITEQDMDDPFVGTMRLTVEMEDGTNVWYGQQQVAQVKLTQRSSAEAKAEEKAKAAKKKAKAKGKKTGAKEKKIKAVETGDKAEKTEAVETEAVETEVVEKEVVRLDYTGEDVWNFKVPMGKGEELVRPDVRAYAAEYGFVVSGKAGSNRFVIVSYKYKNVANADEIMVRNQGNPNVLKPKMTGKALREGEGADEGEGGGGD
jgi:hypothetical protein